jgi:hypothetical protein
MKVFLASIIKFNDDDEYNIIKQMKKPLVFTTENLAEIYIANQIYKMLMQNKKEINDKLRSTGSKKYQTPYVDKDGVVDVLYKDDLSIMLKLREIFLTSDVCYYLIDYDIDEEDVIEEL